jgi:hypothetical protein
MWSNASVQCHWWLQQRFKAAAGIFQHAQRSPSNAGIANARRITPQGLRSSHGARDACSCGIRPIPSPPAAAMLEALLCFDSVASIAHHGLNNNQCSLGDSSGGGLHFEGVGRLPPRGFDSGRNAVDSDLCARSTQSMFDERRTAKR